MPMSEATTTFLIVKTLDTVFISAEVSCSGILAERMEEMIFHLVAVMGA